MEDDGWQPITIDSRPATAAELVAMGAVPWTPPETEQQRSARNRLANAEALARAQAEIADMSIDEVHDWLVEGQAQDAAWGPFEERWAILRCLRNRAPWN